MTYYYIIILFHIIDTVHVKNNVNEKKFKKLHY